jgi:hypothetical protein
VRQSLQLADDIELAERFQPARTACGWPGRWAHTDTTMIFKIYGQWIPDLDAGAGSRMASKAG